MEDSAEKRTALFLRSKLAHHLRYSGRYVGPANIVMKFKNFNPLMDPKMEASQYEDSFSDVGREEMEKRFSERRGLFLAIYNREQPGQNLSRYMKAAQSNEGYRYKPAANTGPVSLFLGGSVPMKHLRKGELPECHLLGFIDENETVGCMAHPLAETSQGHDGRNQVGFFHHTDCCNNVGCEASKEFRFLSTSARRVFDKAVNGMSWYEFSRHATSVLVYYLRCYDHLFQMLDERGLLNALTLERLVEFTNALYDKWPLKRPDWSGRHPLNAIRFPEFPLPGIDLGTASLNWHTGTAAEYERPEPTRSIQEDIRVHKEKWMADIPLRLESTDKGYRFVLTFPEGERAINMHLKNGNTPVLKGNLVPELWRAGFTESETWSGTDLTRGKKFLLQHLQNYLEEDSRPMNSLDILSADIPLTERMLYLALDTWFLRDHFAAQIEQARNQIERSIKVLAGE